LERWSKKDPRPAFSSRCKALLLSNKGYAVKELCDIFSVNSHTIRGWFDRWETQKIVGLHDKKGRGRKAKIDLTNDAHQQALEKAVDKHPQDVARIRLELEESLSMDLSKSLVKRMLKKTVFDGAAAAYVQSTTKTPKNIKTS
jgi:transposase